ncbi:MAG: sugar ABC transporter permease [Devosia sp. 66-22]|nr:MAG: sugar ABC transporter permease [Devosia sp. 66-22]
MHRIFSQAIILLIVLVQVYPLVWILLTALRPAQEFAAGNPFALPSVITLENFQRAFAQGNLGHYLLNSAIVTLAADALIVALGMMAAYAIQVLGFKYSRFVLGLFIVGIVVPAHVTLVPLFLNYRNFGLLNSYWSIIVPLVGFSLPMAVYLFQSFYSYIPRELYDAATVDGAGPYRTFFSITVPMSVNTVVTVVFVNTIFIWNDFIFANTFVLDKDMKTVPLGLQSYMGAMGSIDWTATFAAVCVTVTPLLLALLVLNRAIIYGIQGGATKG